MTAQLEKPVDGLLYNLECLSSPLLITRPELVQASGGGLGPAPGKLEVYDPSTVSSPIPFSSSNRFTDWKYWGQCIAWFESGSPQQQVLSLIPSLPTNADAQIITAAWNSW